MLGLMEMKAEIDDEHATQPQNEIEGKDEKDPFSQIQYVASAVVNEVNGKIETVANLSATRRAPPIDLPIQTESNIIYSFSKSMPTRLATIATMANMNNVRQKIIPDLIYDSSKRIACDSIPSHEGQMDRKVIKKRKSDESPDMAVMRFPPGFATKLKSIATIFESKPRTQPHTESTLLKELLSRPINYRVQPPLKSHSAARKSTGLKKVMPPLRRISEPSKEDNEAIDVLAEPSIEDKEAIDILTCCGNDVSDNVYEIATKPPVFANKIDAVTRMLGTPISSGDSLYVSSALGSKYQKNRLESTEELENDSIDEPNGDDILARLNELDGNDVLVKINKSDDTPQNKIKVETLNEDYDEPLNLVKRKVESLEQLFNTSQYSSKSTNNTSPKREPHNKNKVKSKSAVIHIEINENDERYTKYDPKIEITKLMALLLKDKDYNPSVITWVDSSKGIFKITDTSEFAKLRGRQRSSNSYMEFKHVNRNIRYHTHAKTPGKGTGKLFSIPGQRLTYQFTEEMEQVWMPSQSNRTIYCESHS